MLDHMFFNLKKWFAVDDNDTTIKANGKNYIAMPETVQVMNNFDNYSYSMSSVVDAGNYQVIGILNDNGKKYIVRNGGQYGIIDSSHVISTSWGVKAL